MIPAKRHATTIHAPAADPAGLHVLRTCRGIALHARLTTAVACPQRNLAVSVTSPGGSSLAVHRTDEDDRRGQSLHHIGKDEDCRCQLAPAHEWQMHARGAFAQITRGVIHAGRDALKGRGHSFQRHRQTAQDMGKEQRHDCSARQRPGRDAESSRMELSTILSEKPTISIRICPDICNLSLMAGSSKGMADGAEAWAEGLPGTLAHWPQGGDTDQIRSVAAGECDLAVANSYCQRRLQVSQNRADFKRRRTNPAVLQTYQGATISGRDRLGRPFHRRSARTGWTCRGVRAAWIDKAKCFCQK